MKSLARPLPLRPSGYEGQVRGLASRFSGKFQAVLNSVRPEIETGVIKTPSVTIVAKIAKALDVSIEDLLK